MKQLSLLFFILIGITACRTPKVAVKEVENTEKNGGENSEVVISEKEIIESISTDNQEFTKKDTTLTEKIEPQKPEKEEVVKVLRVGAERLDFYLEKLKDKNVALVVNQTSVVEQTHLADFLLGKGIQLKKIFAPEHGFRGKADAGEHITDGKDSKTGLPLISLFGKNKKPKASDLQNIDAVVFDIQDVGVRFYTYISTMHYIMEACAENDKKCIVFDRPNPNGHYVDGMVREAKHKSFVGMHPIPIVHGLTVGELAQMINGEGWLKNGVKCDLEIIPCENYTHKTPYNLPIKPSPNLPNVRSIALYPTLCLFEGTQASIGRGTDFPFQVVGIPNFPTKDFSFIPESKIGAKNPKYKGQVCYGFDYRQTDDFETPFSLKPLIEFYQKTPQKAQFFKSYLTLLYGSEQLRKDLEAGKTEVEIRASWQADLEKYKKIRKKYLLYPDFE